MNNENQTSPKWRLLAILVISLLPASANALQVNGIQSPNATVNFTEPDGTNDTIAEGEDFATIELGDPWDMDEESDVFLSKNMTNERFEDGVFLASTTTSSYFYVLWQGYPNAQNIGKTGQAHPIEADKYYRISVALCSNTEGSLYFYWFYGVGTSNFGQSAITNVQPGCWVYVHDLRDLDGVNGKYWTGQINGLRVDPKINNGEIQVHWVRLTANPSPDNGYTISWNNLEPFGASQEMTLSVDTDNVGFDGWIIHTQDSPPESGSYAWMGANWPTPADFEPGSYYLYAEINEQPAGYSQFPVSISTAPQLHILSPSYTSGEDYSTDMGNPWDMSNEDDVSNVSGVSNYYFQSDQLHLENNSIDPRVELSVPSAINSHKYRYLTVRMHSERARNVDHGTVARVFWHTIPFNLSWVATSQNIIVYPGWQEYSLDLSQIELVTGSPSWENNTWDVIRWDPNENTTGETWHTIIGDVKLTATPTADTSFIIQWEVDNPEDEVITTTWYYDTDNSSFDGTLIGPGRRENINDVVMTDLANSIQLAEHYIYLPLIARNFCSGDCLVWDTSSVPPGEYYIYGCVDDGSNQLCRYSEVPVLVR